MFLSCEQELLITLKAMPYVDLLEAGRILMYIFGNAVHSPQMINPGELSDFISSAEDTTYIDKKKLKKGDIEEADIGFGWITKIRINQSVVPVNGDIPVLAIDVLSNEQRSKAAYYYHECLSRVFNLRLIILVRSEEGFCFTMTNMLPNGKRHILLSDWFSYDEHGLELLEQIDPLSLSISSTVAYYSDFINAFSREYYYHPESISNLTVKLLQDAIYAAEGEDLDISTLRMFSENAKKAARRYYLDMYGDDYIEYEDYVAPNDEYEIEDEEFDFDILEEELNQIIDPNEMDDDTYEQEDIEDESNMPDLKEIPEYLLKNPILLIKWLDSH